MPDRDADVERILSAAADRSSPCARVFRHWEGRHVSVRPVDFYQVLKRCEVLVVRLDITGVTPIDCRVRDELEFATESYDQGTATRQEFLDKIQNAASIDVRHHAESYFGDGGSNSESQPDPDDDPFACSLCGCYLGELTRVQGNDYCDACQHDTKEYVVCDTCGDRLPQSRATSVDVSPPDEYYPELIYYCPEHAPSTDDNEDTEVATDGGVVETDTPVKDAVFDALDRHGGKNGQAQAGDVVADVLVETNHGVGSFCACLHRLHATGEIYQPNATQIKRTDHHEGGDA